jgi:hypothetical protein
MSNAPETTVTARELDAGMMIRRALFLLLLIGVTYFYLGIDFRGLSSPRGMEQAQIARQIANGSSFTTKVIKPLPFTQVREKMLKDDPASGGPSLASGIPDTYHSPLNPLINSLALGMLDKETWKMGEKQKLFTPDVIIAGVSMILLLASIGVNYLLISRIFDAKIGGITALLMLLCESLWRYSQSGLPQILMLFLFSFAIYFLYKAVENTQAGKPVYLWIALTGGFMGLLALAHWMAIWPFLGLVLFAGFYFNPRGVQLLTLIGVFLLITIWWPLFHNMKWSGNPLGAGLYLFYAGNAVVGDESGLMRDLEQSAGALDLNGLPSKVVINGINQLGDIYNYLGASIAAPLFFLALLHPFRRREIADFRWCILGMWLFAVVGMTIYGLKPHSEENPTDPNNLHIIFMPVMTGYGLAFLAVLWNRLNLPLHIPVVRNGHFIAAVLISALPVLMLAPKRIAGSVAGHELRSTLWPYYVPKALAEYGGMVKENEVIVTDIPWAVAWYTDRSAVWLPRDKQQLQTMMEYAAKRNQPITGILLSPYILSTPPSELISPQQPNYDWREYILLRPASRLASTEFRSFWENLLNDLTGRMPLKYAVSSEYGNYLFMTANPVVKNENPPASGAN